TTGETIQADCSCAGGSSVFDCPDIQANFGDSCDDGDPNTTGETIQNDCSCAGGSSIYDCPDIQANIGDSCDDGDPNTTGETIQEDCSCALILPCIESSQIDFNVDCSLEFDPVCGCNGITYANASIAENWFGVTSWTPGICSLEYDCLELQAYIGQTCDDGDPNTTGETIQEDCSCALVLPCIESSQIDFNVDCSLEFDPVCGCNGITYANACIAENWFGVTDWTPGMCSQEYDCMELQAYFAQACDDGDPNTTGETILEDCTCGEGEIDCNEVDLKLEYKPLPDFCQGTKVVLSSNIMNAAFYFWSTGENTPNITVDQQGTYSLKVILESGCQLSAETNVKFEEIELLSAYTIIAQDKIDMLKDTVFKGGIGIQGSFRKISLGQQSTIVNEETFVRAPAIQLYEGSTVSHQINEQALVNLPVFYPNTYSSDNNVIIEENNTITLSNDLYGQIEIGDNSTILFTSPDVYVNELIIGNNCKLGFAQTCTNVLINERMEVGEKSQINPDNKAVTFYVLGNVFIRKSAKVTANIYTKKLLFVDKAEAVSPTVMKGMFLAKYVTSKEHVHWTWNTDCHDCQKPLPPQNLNLGLVVPEMFIFDARLKGRLIQIEWGINWDPEVEYFLVERALEDGTFESIGQRKSIGESYRARRYDFDDRSPNPGENIYRLIIVKTNGTIEYSDEKIVDYPFDPDEISLFPNPARQSVFVNLRKYAGRKAHLELYNFQGILLKELPIDELPETPVRLDLTGMRNGMYTITIKVEGKRRISKIFVITQLY
ncbi:MAG: T9SS type A sorting domain-containing protein, partial [Bacteroidetes bacterium]|nr:T9SS type A sorting domain-containing protein [Bacteroidota bacterium]